MRSSKREQAVDAHRERSTADVVLQPLLLSIPEVARSLRLSRTKVYELIDIEGLPVVRFGRAVRVSVEALQQWLQQREQSA
jgi:excisionase family DNA binding protein